MSACTFRAKVCDSIKNDIHHGRNKMRQEVEEFFFVNSFVKKNMAICPTIFYGAVISRYTVIIDPTSKPIILGH